MQPLSDLLEFMQTNTDLNILIKGYVNDPTGANGDKNDQVLSENRAKAVLKYLTEHNIAKNRMAHGKALAIKTCYIPMPEHGKSKRPIAG